MKVCFPVESANGFDSRVFKEFGPAPAFVIFDTESNTLAGVVNNTPRKENEPCDPVKALNDLKVDAIIVNCIGAEAFDKLNEAGIKVYQANATIVRENLATFAGNGLQEYTQLPHCASPAATEAVAH
jgi:predicted Fe-Mo cluster-binding NifX family protein